MPSTRHVFAVAALLAAAATLAGVDDWPAPSEWKERANPVPAGPETRAAGRAIYDDRCVMCHGDEGHGDGISSAYLQVEPEDLSLPEIQAQTDGVLYWKVTTGRRPMPGFEDKLSDEERWQVIHHVRTLAVQSAEKSAKNFVREPAEPAESAESAEPTESSTSDN